MRPSYIVPFAFGFLLVYIGIFGLGGFQVSASFSLSRIAANSYDQFTSATGWTISSSGGAAGTSPAIVAFGPSDGSSVHLTAPSGLQEMDWTTVGLLNAASWTMFFSADVISPNFQVEYYGNTYEVTVEVGSGGTLYADPTTMGTVSLNAWHNYRVQVTNSGANVAVAVDASRSGTYTTVGNYKTPASSASSPAIELQAYSGGEAYVDWIELDGSTQTIPTQVTNTTTSSQTNSWTLSVVSAHGSPSPSVGSHTYSDGVSVTCSVATPVTESGVSYTCTGWSGTGSVPSSGSSASATFTISQNSTITWNWQATVVTASQYKLTVSSAYGTPNPGVGDHLFASGASVTCSVGSTATDNSGASYTCTGWTGTGSVQSSGTAVTTTFTISQNSTITWNWKSSTAGTVGPWSLTVVSNYGNPNPNGGSYSDGDSVTCSVTSPVTEGSTTYTCTGWSGSGSVPSSGSGASVTFTISQNSAITWNWQSSSSSSSTGNNSVPSFNVNIDWNGIWKNLNSIVDANREPLLTLGGVIMLFSFIGFMLPAKRLPISF